MQAATRPLGPEPTTMTSGSPGELAEMAAERGMARLSQGVCHSVE
jgi:hypothetical protein